MAQAYSIQGLGAQLRTARRNARLQQATVADALGMARTTIVAIEKNERRLSPAELEAFAQLYNIPIEALKNTDEPLPAIGKLSSREQRLIQAWRSEDFETIMLLVGMAIRRKRQDESEHKAAQ